MAAALRRNVENNAVIADGDLKKKSTLVLTRRPIASRQALGVISNQIPQAVKQEKDLKPAAVIKVVKEKPILKVVDNKPKVAVVLPFNNKCRPLTTATTSGAAVTLTSGLAKKLDQVSLRRVEEAAVASTSQPASAIPNIDEGDFGNPQLVSIYVNEIYDYLRSVEVQYPVNVDFLNGRRVTGRMRSIILDWLLQVCLKFELLPETFYLTVDIFDRYIQKPDEFVHKENLQLIGVTSLFIATKYEEMYSPPIDDYVYITDKSCSAKDIRLMEIKILKGLNFFLGKPTPLHFLRRNSKSGEVDVMVHTLAKYFIELTIMEYTMAHTRPSMLAAAALCFSLQLLKQVEWNAVLQHHSKYIETELKPVMKSMAQLVIKSETAKLQAVRMKFSAAKFMKISLIPELKSSALLKMARIES